MVLVIGYDTTGNSPYASCMCVGRPDAISKLNNQIEKIIRAERHTGALHWADIDWKIKKRCRIPLISAVKNGGVIFYVYTHKRPPNWKRQDYYFKHLPNQLSAVIETHIDNHCGKSEKIEFICDDDFDKIKGSKGTFEFVESFLKRLGSRIRGVEVSPKKTRTGAYEVRISWPGGQSRLLEGKVGNNSHSSIILADMILGMNKEYGQFDKLIPKKIK